MTRTDLKTIETPAPPLYDFLFLLIQTKSQFCSNYYFYTRTKFRDSVRQSWISQSRVIKSLHFQPCVRRVRLYGGLWAQLELYLYLISRPGANFRPHTVVCFGRESLDQNERKYSCNKNIKDTIIILTSPPSQLKYLVINIS